MKRNRGFTLIELMIVIVVMAIGITLAVPSFRDLIERKSVGGAAEAAYEQLQRARSQAVKRSKPILVDFYAPDGTNWAIGFTDKLAGCNAGDDAAGTNPCTIEYDNDTDVDYGADGISDELLMRIQGSSHRNITMESETAFANAGALTGGCAAAPPGTACFDNVRGLARTGEYNFASTNYELQVQVDQLGHVTICNSGDKTIVGYDDCP